MGAGGGVVARVGGGTAMAEAPGEVGMVGRAWVVGWVVGASQCNLAGWVGAKALGEGGRGAMAAVGWVVVGSEAGDLAGLGGGDEGVWVGEGWGWVAAGVAAGWEGAKVRVAAREAVAQVVGCHKERR